MKYLLGIQAKFLALILVLLTIIFGALALFYTRTTIKSLRQALTSEAETFAVLATQPIGKTFALYHDSGTLKIDNQVDTFTEVDPTITNVAVLDLEGHVAYRRHAKEYLPSVTATQAASFQKVFLSDPSGKLLGVIQPFVDDNGIHESSVLYVISNASIDQSVYDGIVAIGLFALATLGITAFALFVTMNQLFLLPIRRVSAAALLISSGKLEQEIKSTRHDEIGDLAQSVNTMANSLKADIVKLKEVDELKSEFMMITSHNLRTPLSLINGYLDTLKTMHLETEAASMVETIAANSARLGTLAEDILTISQIEAGQQMSVTTEAINLTKLTDQIAVECQTLAKKREIMFSYLAAPTSTMVAVGAPQFRQAIWNLLDNALKFTKPKGMVRLEVEADGKQALIRVVDTGIGISPAEIPKLFTKFHRGTSTLQYDYEGTGIGLYVSRLVVRQFGGNISAQSELGKGSTFTITVPLAEKLS